MFDLDRIRCETFVEQVEFRPELASTNSLALELSAAVGLRTPLLVLAEKQTAGRGRGTNRWWSGDGALMFSLVVDSSGMAGMELSVERRPQISLATGLAVREALAQVLPAAGLGLKWPNDVYLNSRKVCGILTEVPHRAPHRSVIGIGVNVNNPSAMAPSEVRGLAVSLRDVSGREHDLTDVLVRLLRQIETELSLLARDDLDLPGRWRPYCILQGRIVSLTAGSRVTTGLCAGIDAKGALLLHTEAGPQRFFGGTVTFAS